MAPKYDKKDSSANEETRPINDISRFECLWELHRGLMGAIYSEQDEVPIDIQTRIDNLGWYTQEVLVNTAESPPNPGIEAGSAAVGSDGTNAGRSPTCPINGCCSHILVNSPTPEARSNQRSSTNPTNANGKLGDSIDDQEDDSAKPKAPLRIACLLGKLNTVRILYRWHTRLRPEWVHEILSKAPTSTRHVIVREMIINETAPIHSAILMTACELNEVAIVSMCCDFNLLNMINGPKQQDKDKLAEELCMQFCPLKYAICCGSIDLVRTLYQVRSAADFEGLTELQLAAFRGYRPIVDLVLSSQNVPEDTTQSVFEIFGAACILDDRAEEGKAAWAEALAVSKDKHDDRAGEISHVALLEKTIDTSWSKERLDKMTPRELSLQALIVMERYFEDKRLFTDALLAQPVSIKLTLHALDVLVQAKKLTIDSLRRVEEHLVSLGFFNSNCDKKLRVGCLEWCVFIMSNVQFGRLQLDKRIDWPGYFVTSGAERQTTPPEAKKKKPHLRVPDYDELVDFTCRVVLSLEQLDEAARQDNTTCVFVNGLLSQIVRSCELVEKTCQINSSCTLRDRLKDKCPHPSYVFELLNTAGLDLSDGEEQ